MRRLHVIGRKNCGKTTLIVELIQELSSRGLRVGSVKHTHHHHELDTPGKDSFRHREAGAAAVGILSPGMDAAFRPRSNEDTEADRYAAFEALFADCDVILVEGDSSTTASRVEVWRQAAAERPISASDDSILAVITDDPVDLSTPVWPRKDIAALAVRVLELVAQSH